MTVKLKRAYEPPEPDDGERYLVDRLWPRGVRREALQLHGWLKELAPSTELRRWYNHEPELWDEFKVRYRGELAAPASQVLLQQLATAADGQITLIFAARDEARNEAVVLKEIIEKMRKRR